MIQAFKILYRVKVVKFVKLVNDSLDDELRYYLAREGPI